MAEKHPQAQVIGLDISPQQKPHVTIPANCSFILHDIRNRLPFRDNCFDFVHMRDMQSAVTFSWEILLREINRILVPGGWVQFAEFIYQHSTESRSPEVKSKLRDSPIGRLETRFIEVLLLIITISDVIGGSNHRTDNYPTWRPATSRR